MEGETLPGEETKISPWDLGHNPTKPNQDEMSPDGMGGFVQRVYVCVCIQDGVFLSLYNI